MNPIDPDAPLVERAQAGELAAFEALVDRHEGRILTHALRIVRQREDAEEVVQDTFLSAVEHLAGFRKEASFKSWLYRIATNHALHLLRRRKSLPTVSLDLAGDESLAGLPHPDYVARWRGDPEALAELPETRRLIGEALAELDEKYRLVFLLRDVAELSTRETAEALEITETNVKVRLLRARLMLRERLTRALGDEATRIRPSHDHAAAGDVTGPGARAS